jgi:tRNA threonylcarbamoyladenosine biosynthesis protein TsaE
MKTVHNIISAAKMREFGAAVAVSICKKNEKSRNQTFVIALQGELGAGKTQFAKGFAKGLGVKQTINSPTFVICKQYKISNKEKFFCRPFENFFHIDCYRLQKSKDLGGLDFKKILAGKNNLVIIEWPGLAKKFLPRNTLWLNFETTAKNTRRASIL